MNITDPYVSSASNEEIDKLLTGINDLRRKIAETEAYISRAAQRRGYALVTTEDYVAAVDRLCALKLDLAGSEWKVEDILIKRLADHGIYTTANLQMFRRQS